MTMSHYAHHIKAVLIAGRKWCVCPENKIGLKVDGGLRKSRCNIKIVFLNYLQGHPHHKLKVKFASDNFHMDF